MKKKKELELEGADNADLLAKSKELIRRRVAKSGAKELQPLSSIEESGRSADNFRSVAKKEAEDKEREVKKERSKPLDNGFNVSPHEVTDEEVIETIPNSAIDLKNIKEIESPTLEDYDKEVKTMDKKDPKEYAKLRLRYKNLFK